MKINNRNNIASLLSKLENSWIIILRGEIDDYKKWEDIDFFANREIIAKIIKILEENNFSRTHENSSKIFFKYFFDNKIIIFDIAKNCDYVFDLFKWVHFDRNYTNEYLNNPKKNKDTFSCIRYIHMLRNDKKALSFLKGNFKVFSKNNFFLKYLNVNIFKKKISEKDLDWILKKSPLALFRTLKLRYFLWLPLWYYNKYKIHVNNWVVVCLSGVDWVWKTTICEVMQKMTKGKYIYLWYWDTKSIFWNYFNKIQSKNPVILSLKYFLRYIENLLLLPLILAYKFSWRIVIIDRHPLLETAQLPKWLFSKISTFLYKYFYYTPKNIFILYEDAEVIYERKPEKNINKIKEYQKKQKRYIKNQNIKVTFLKNTDINKTCSIIFKNIM